MVEEYKNINSENTSHCKTTRCEDCSRPCFVDENINSDGDKCFNVIKFKGHRIDVFLNYKNIKLFNGDNAIVTAEMGLDMGKVIHTFHSTTEKVEKKYKGITNKTVVRKATEKDLEKLYINKEEEKDVIEKVSIISQSYGLDMKIIDAEWQFDKYKLTIFFTAPQRIDFRELVKDLAKQFKSRIELRQINTRDEIVRVGGSVGCCGRLICCNTFLIDDTKVTLEQVKLQRLSNSVSKLSGNCSRLKCCMAFEYDFYRTELVKYPALHSKIIKDNVEYKLNRIDVLKQQVILYNSKDKSHQVLSSDELMHFLKNANVITPVSTEEVNQEIIVEEDIIIDD